jgi:hypothetical protein
MVCGPAKGASEEAYYLSEWSQAERADGLHVAALAFAYEAKSERGPRRAAVGAGGAGTAAAPPARAARLAAALGCCGCAQGAPGGGAPVRQAAAAAGSAGQGAPDAERERAVALASGALGRLLGRPPRAAAVAPDGSHRSGSTAAASGPGSSGLPHSRAASPKRPEIPAHGNPQA